MNKQHLVVRTIERPWDRSIKIRLAGVVEALGGWHLIDHEIIVSDRTENPEDVIDRLIADLILN